MSKYLPLHISSSNSIIGFETAAGGNLPVWDRFLTIKGKRAYHIGNVCNTCEFFFERLDGANQSVDTKDIADTLEHGLEQLEPGFVERTGMILPKGQYYALVTTVLPALVSPGSIQDYFCHEQVDLWGIDGFWGLPHYPKTEYYRTRMFRFGERKALYEFIVPIFPHVWLDRRRVEQYQQQLETGRIPTALTLTLLDIKQPANWDGDPAITEHWCLVHYLLDGHHKTFAAASLGKPISLLSYLAVEASLANETELDIALNTILDDSTG
jgi:hypothetical protein